MSKCAMRFAPSRELRRHARDAVVEARAERDQEIAVVDGVVRERRAVHAEHAHRQRMRRVDAAESHQRRHHGNARTRRQNRAQRVSLASPLMTPPPA